MEKNTNIEKNTNLKTGIKDFFHGQAPTLFVEGLATGIVITGSQLLGEYLVKKGIEKVSDLKEAIDEHSMKKEMEKNNE